MSSASKRTILVSAGALAMAIVLVGYSVYAWFNMSKEISATGIQLGVTAPNNVQISLTGGDNEDDWKEDVTVNIAEILKKQIQDFDNSKPYFVLPSSSLGGFNGTLFATNRAKIDGTVQDDTVFYSGHPMQLISRTNSYEGHYVDVPLYFRTADENPVELLLDKNENADGVFTNISSKDKSAIYKIVRVAFLNADALKNSVDGAEPMVYASEDRQISTVVTGESQKFEIPQFLTFGSDNLSDKPVVKLKSADYSSGKVQYHPVQILLRIWIEGQDKSCTVDMGNKSFGVDLSFTAK